MSKTVLIVAPEEWAAKDPSVTFLEANLKGVLALMGETETRVAVTHLADKDVLVKLDDPTLCLIVLPGAKGTTLYRNEMTPDVRQHLIARVQGGVGIVGICAGAALLAQASNFLSATGLALGSHDNLGLLPAIAMGDIRPFMETRFDSYHLGFDFAAAPAVRFNEISAPCGDIPMLHLGGPIFTPLKSESAQELTRCASYPNTDLAEAPACIMSARYGKGYVLAIGPHIEMSSTVLEDDRWYAVRERDQGAYRRQLIETLKPHDTARQQAFAHLLRPALG